MFKRDSVSRIAVKIKKSNQIPSDWIIVDFDLSITSNFKIEF